MMTKAITFAATAFLAAGLVRAAAGQAPSAETAERQLRDSPRHGEWVDIEIPGDPAGEFTWIAFHVDDPCPRICRYLAALRIAQNTPLRMRRPVTLAVRAIRAGGAAVIEYGDAQTYWDRTERGPVRFEVVEACELAAATSHSAGRALFNTLNPNLESL